VSALLLPVPQAQRSHISIRDTFETINHALKRGLLVPRYVFSLIGEPDHYDRWDAASEEQHQGVFNHFRAFTEAVREQGMLVAGEAFDRPSRAFTARRDTQPRITTDGPFAEVAEQLCGFYLADLPNEAAARDLALLLPPDYSVEVRHCPDVGVTPR
jgi:hypothetical protein